jgi:hypothetical protein
VGFVVYEVALGQVFLLRVLRVSPINAIPPVTVMIFACQRRCMILAIDNVFELHNGQASGFLAPKMTILPVDAVLLSDDAATSQSETRISQSGIMLECLK